MSDCIQQLCYKNLFSQIGQFYKYVIALIIITCLVICGNFKPLSSAYAHTVDAENVFFSIDTKQMPLKRVNEIISNKTGYDIIFDQKWKDQKVTIKLDKIPLFLGLRRIIKQIGIKNCAIVQNKNQIQVFTFEGAATNSMPNNLSSDIGIKLTLAQLKALKKINEEKINNMPKGTIITPPSESGDKLTWGELEALKKAQEKKMENMPKNTIITPPSNSGKGLTLKELKALQKHFD